VRRITFPVPRDVAHARSMAVATIASLFFTRGTAGLAGTEWRGAVGGGSIERPVLGDRVEHDEPAALGRRLRDACWLPGDLLDP
jgi:hypothetical protein